MREIKELSFVEIQILQQFASWEMLILSFIVITIACFMQVTSRSALRLLDQLLLPKLRLALGNLLRLFVLYVLMHALMLWTSYTGLPLLALQIIMTQLPAVLIGLATLGLMITICWLISWVTKRKVNTIFVSLLYAITTYVLFLYFSSKYSLVIHSGTAAWHDYMFQPYALLILLMLYTLSAYGRGRVRMTSLGMLTAEELDGQPLELLYTLQRHQQILRNQSETDVYYVHDIAANVYYPYKVQQIRELPRASRRSSASGNTQDAQNQPLSRVKSRAKKHNKQLSL